MGPDYAHAEARKSPALDGKVERDSEGKEIRYPVMLTAMEKLVARKVCLAFKVKDCVNVVSVHCEPCNRRGLVVPFLLFLLLPVPRVVKDCTPVYVTLVESPDVGKTMSER